MKEQSFFPQGSTVRDCLAVTALAILVILIYANTLQSPFIFDDWYHIEGNPAVRISALSPVGLLQAGFASPIKTRPVANASFALNYLFHGYDVIGYHVVNLLIHLVTSVILYFFLRATFLTPALAREGSQYDWLPLGGALIWAVHPLHIQSVTYIVQRMNSLAAMFYVLSFLLYVKARLAHSNRVSVALALGCIVSALLALGSKEIAATLPFFMVLYEWYFFQDLTSDWMARHKKETAWVGILLLGFALFICWHWNVAGALQGSYQIRDFTMAQRLLTELRVVVLYMSLLVFPHPARLNLDHDFQVSASLFDPFSTVMSLVVIGVMMWFALKQAKRFRLLSFCLLWFLGNLVIESSVIGLELVFEHRTYLPSMFAILLVLLLVQRYIKVKWLKLILLCIVTAIFSLWTFERNRVWQDEIVLRTDAVAKSPQKPRAHAILANALEREGKLDEAEQHYLAALHLNPQNAWEIHYNLGNVLLHKQNFPDAAKHYAQSLAIKPDAAVIRLNLGIALEQQGLFEAAAAHYREIIRRNPGFARAYNNLGTIYLRQQRFPEAIESFRQALRLKANFGLARRNLARAVLLKGEKGYHPRNP